MATQCVLLCNNCTCSYVKLFVYAAILLLVVILSAYFRMEPGICYIKEEYLIKDSNLTSSPTPVPDDYKRKFCDAGASACVLNDIIQDEDQNGNSSSPKYQKNNKKERKRGQNKKRPIYKEDRTLHLCNSLINGPKEDVKCNVPNCRYVHDISQYLAGKGDDIGEECPVFKTKGFCPRGVTCRFSKSHLNADGCNIKADDYDESKENTTQNGISAELQVRLRKRDYDFTRSKEVIAHFDKLREERKKQKALGESTKIEIEPLKPIGAVVDDEDTGGRDIKPKTPVDFANKLVLSPLTTVGNLPFRRICKEYGADITCGEMACCVPLLKGLTQEWALTKRHESEDIFGVQICGNNPNTITQTTQLLQESTRVDFIDLNIGCPIDLIFQQGGGSALMRRTNILELAVRACSTLNKNIPFTVKMRTGVYADKSVAHELLPLVEEWGAAAVTLHGRSREQRYTKNANWAYIEECASKVKHIPVIGNGDILSYEDFNERKQCAPHVSSVMIGRGALIKPWIFEEIKSQKHLDPTSTQRFDMLRKYVNYGLEHWGSDTKGVENTRRFFLEWQSFLYRYIPYDLLANPPQKINERPQTYRGRDEMETLMSSPNSTDWVKLSEMLLGRVPEGFSFVPKHKANAY